MPDFLNILAATCSCHALICFYLFCFFLNIINLLPSMTRKLQLKNKSGSFFFFLKVPLKRNKKKPNNF